MFIECDNRKAHAPDVEELIEQTWTEYVVATEDGLFCGQPCAKSAEEDRYYRMACEDRDSWYWETHTPPWE